MAHPRKKQSQCHALARDTSTFFASRTQSRDDKKYSSLKHQKSKEGGNTYENVEVCFRGANPRRKTLKKTAACKLKWFGQ